MPDNEDLGSVAVLEREEENQVDGDEDEVVTPDVENEEAEDGAEDQSAEGAATSDDNTEGGSGDPEGEGESAAVEGSVVTPPTGKALLDLLAGDSDAQQLMAHTLQSMMTEQAATAAAQAEAQEFNELVQKGDHAEIGRRVLERATSAQARTQIADEVLKETFRPVYADLFSQPEMQALSAEEKDVLNPQKYTSDAHYVRAVSDFVSTKRYEKSIEAEVEKRIKARDEAAGNRKTAGTAATKSLGATPGATVAVQARGDSRSLIAAGLAESLGRSTDDDGDEEN